MIGAVKMATLSEVKNHYGKLKLLINGEWVESQSSVWQETTNPATEAVIAEFPRLPWKKPGKLLRQPSAALKP
jgi:hypothetical protein